MTVDDIGQEGGEVVGRWKEFHRQELAEFDWKSHGGLGLTTGSRFFFWFTICADRQLTKRAELYSNLSGDSIEPSPRREEGERVEERVLL